MFNKLEANRQRYTEIELELARPEVATNYDRVQALVKERASLEILVALYGRYRETKKEIEDARTLLREAGEEELRALAREEIQALEAREGDLERQLRFALLPKDPNDEKNVIVEIRAGAGGEEAALFAGDLFRMYIRYAQLKSWRTEAMNSSETGIGGFKEVIFEIIARGAFSRLKYESGVHRVQRVPATEASGRLHTSTATVAILPEAEEVEVQINPADLRMDIFHSGGAGGQNVNKVATAIRITHFPTGIVVTCQDERSQLKNKTKAMAVLRARLLAREQQKQQEEIVQTRRAQVGTAERSEKVRTYNFPQNRVSDHRINMTLHSLDRVLEGELDPLIDALAQAEQERALAASVA